MPEPRTCTSNCFIGLDCRQRCMTLCGEQGHNFAPEGVFEMPVWLRRGWWGLAALLLMLALVAGYLVSTFDANRYKSVAVDWMKVHRNRSLVIDGPIELSVFPRLAVKLSRLRLSEVGKPDDFAALEEAGLAVDVLPLLRGELVIDRVRAKGVRLVYVRDPKNK